MRKSNLRHIRHVRTRLPSDKKERERERLKKTLINRLSRAYDIRRPHITFRVQEVKSENQYLPDEEEYVSMFLGLKDSLSHTQPRFFFVHSQTRSLELVQRANRYAGYPKPMYTQRQKKSVMDFIAYIILSRTSSAYFVFDKFKCRKIKFTDELLTKDFGRGVSMYSYLSLTDTRLWISA